MQLTKENINKIARLARLRIEDTEVPAITERLGKILGWVEQLEEINTDNIEPMVAVNLLQMPRRDDVVDDGNLQSAILQNAPEKEFVMFAVPKVVE